MDWPHDPDGEQGSEGMRKYGQAIIAKKVNEDEDFPLSRDEFVEAHGDEPIRIDYQTVVSLRDVFENVEQESFDDFVAFHKAVGRAMRESGYWFYEGAEKFVGGKNSA
ncbi:DUF5785 family protein [Halogeometricum limi]|uniref:Uncharacterized protein n=1 Tax=Halogeometricum limi TaxID=555875 RepID=A0A1I6HYY4_9EURY|nr:DUF5785 family protein [Halogeometricum limi]SFR59420.1 hypothetical protein SAMN04488124_2600 [Halogeometricum limi]